MLMIVGLMPDNIGLFTTTALAAPDEKSAYYLDAADLNADTVNAAIKPSDDAIKNGTDTSVGTDNFFTISAVGKKNQVCQPQDADKQPTEVDTPVGTYSQALQLGGQLQNAADKYGQAGLKFTTTKPAKVTVYAAVKAVNDAKHNFWWMKEGETAINKDYEMVNDPTVCNKIVLDLDEAGTYYLGGHNGANIFFVEVKYKKDGAQSFDVNSIDESLFDSANGNILKAESTIGTNDAFKVYTTGNKVKLNDRTALNLSYNDTAYPKALTLDGTLKNSGQGAIEFTTTQTTRVTILAAAKGNSAVGKSLWLKNKADFKDMADFSEAGLIIDTIQEYVANNLPAGTYFIGGESGVDIFNIKIEPVTTYVMDANDIDDALVSDSDKITTDTVVGTDNYFVVLAQGSKNQIKTSANTSFNGKAYTKKIQLTGGAKLATGQACMKINVSETARITMVAAAKGGSGADTNIGIAKVGDTAITSMGKLVWNAGANAGEIQEYMLDNVKPGEYYIASDAGADIFEITVEYDPLDIQVTPWDEVETPVINTVTVDADGNFVVNFSATVNKTTGAEKLYVIMSESGNEMATTTVQKQTDSVVMTPLWSGNYSFKVIAVREGESQKVSNIVEHPNYILAVRKPVIVAEQNRGSGKYYVDWFNLDEADSYQVQVDGNTVADNLTSAHYELTGLSEGKHTVKIIAVRNLDGFKANYEKEINVTSDAAPQWYVAIFGSAQETNAVLTEANGTQTTYALSTRDTAPKKENLVAAPNITNTTGKIELKSSDAGKISDGEEGFSYYFTYLDPNTENFKLSAKFKITDVSKTPDNQTGFGIMATDMPGINFFGAPDYYHKLYNEVSAIYWKQVPTAYMRIVTGYSNPDTSNSDDVTRDMNEQKFSTKADSMTVGQEVEFTVEKTNDKWIVSCGEETKEYEDTSILSVQEDGSICIGVMTSRKVGVEVSDIKYSTSPSTGVSGGDKDTRITPNTQVFSTGTSGSKSYEYIYAANTAGKLTVKLNGSEIYNQDITADTAIRVPATLKLGKNTFESEFTPSGTTETLTNTDKITKTAQVECKQYGLEGQTIYVSPDGTADGDGTSESPLDLATVVKYAQPGQVIVLKDGTYTKGIRIDRSVCGTADKMITMIPENDGAVVFDGAAIELIGSYWHIYGFEVANVSSGNGIKVAGNHNIIEMCKIHNSTNTGLQISRAGVNAENKLGIEGELWPSHNLIKNCESYDNCDAGMNDADGFAAKLTSGRGNVFYGCIAHHNIDDGWDLFAKTISGEIGAVTIENCVAYNNGWLSTDPSKKGEGNGFKLGGGYLKGGHVLRNSISFANGAKGITSNSCPDCEVYDCTNFGNAVNDNTAYNIGLNRKVSAAMEWKVSGLISMGNGNTKSADLFPVSLESATNYIYNGSASYNTNGVEAVNSWFTSVDVSKVPVRNADGTINMGGLLELTAEAPQDTGARLDVTSDRAKSVKPSITTVITPSGDIDIEIKPEENVPETKVDMPEEDIADAVLDEADKKAVAAGDDIKIVVQVKDAESTVSAEDKTKVEEKITETGYEKGQYLDISIQKVVNGNPIAVTNTPGKLAITITIPESLKNTDSSIKRIFAVIRVHEGVVDILDNISEDENLITIETDKFSTYTLVYKDVKTEPEQPGDSSSDDDDKEEPEQTTQPVVQPTQPVQPTEPTQQPTQTDKSDEVESAGTGDRTPIALYGGLVVLSMLALGAVLLERKKRFNR